MIMLVHRIFTLLVLVAALCGIVFSSSAQAELSAVWLFDEGSGTTATDIHNGFIGTLTDFDNTTAGAGDTVGGSGWTTLDGAFNGMLNFDGRALHAVGQTGNDTVRTDYPIGATLSGRSFTLEAVLTHNYEFQNWSPFFGQSDGCCFFFGKRSDTNQLHVNLRGLGGGDSAGIPAIADGNPHHFALVFNDTADTITTYFDQVQVGSHAAAGTLDPALQMLWLGGVAHNANERWDGYADSAVISRDAVSGDGEGVLGPGTFVLSQPVANVPAPTNQGSLIQFNDFSNVSNLRIRGNAGRANNRINLAPSHNDTGGGIFLNGPVQFASDYSFSTSFSFQMRDGAGSDVAGDPLGADGMALVIHQDPRGPAWVGPRGGGMALQGLTPAVVVEFDTWNGGIFDPPQNNAHEAVAQRNGNHVAIDIVSPNFPGVAQSLAQTLPGAIAGLNNGVEKFAWVDYDGGTQVMNIFLSETNTKPGSPTLSQRVPLSQIFSGNDLFLGFTGATGGARESHELINWTFDTTTASSNGPLPAPQTHLVFNSFSDPSIWSFNRRTGSTANAFPGLDAGRLRVTAAVGSQGNSAFLKTPVQLADDFSFNTQFSFEMSAPSGNDVDGAGADGLLFVMHSDGTSTAVGTVGGGMGLATMSNFVAVEFDTWHTGSFDPASNNGTNGNHIAINTSASATSIAQSGPHTAPATPDNPPRFVGGVRYAWVDYNGQTDLMEVFYSETPTKPATAIVSATVDVAALLGYSDHVFLGFTGGTGGAIEQQDVLSWEFHSVPEPSTWALAGLGLLAALGRVVRRRLAR